MERVIAIRRARGQIARAQPAIRREGRRRLLWPPPITGEDVRAADLQLAHRAISQGGPALSRHDARGYPR